MNRLSKWVWGSLLALLLVPVAAFAQSPVETQGHPVYGQRELDMMLAPVALYPDPLLSQVLMAATYPLEVVQAARWSRSHPDLLGDEAVRAVADFDWDPSVKSLVAFPQVLQQMDEKLDWTETLGDAFLAQEDQVMQTVQQLRGRADAAGNLRSTEEMVVERRGDDFILEPPSPEETYVPYYDPRVIYGSWWWPGYDPVYWGPWPGYPYHAGYAGFGWSFGVPVGPGFFFGAFDWPRRLVRFGSHRPFYFHGGARWNPSLRWRHDPGHRHGVPYRNAGSSRYFARDTIRNGWTGRSDRDGLRQYRNTDRPRGERRADAGAPQRALQSSQGFFAPRTGEGAARATRPGGATPVPATPRYRTDRAPREVWRQGAERPRGGERPQVVRRAGGFERPQINQRPGGIERSQVIQRPGGIERSQGSARPGGVERLQRSEQAPIRQSPRSSPRAHPVNPPQSVAAPQRQFAPQRQSVPVTGAPSQPAARSESPNRQRGGGERYGPARQDR